MRDDNDGCEMVVINDGYEMVMSGGYVSWL